MEEYTAYRQDIPLSATGLKVNLDKSSSSKMCLWSSCKNYKFNGTGLLKGKKSN